MNQDQSFVAERLATIAGKLTPPGRFAAGGPAAGLPNPLLRVAGVGDYLGWPVPGAQVEAVIASGAATRAPYGLGEATVTDAAVRDSWRVPPSRLTWDNPAWDGALAGLVADAATALGVAPHVGAVLHNLLLYRPGGHFAAHTDTEKVAGMFGTLVVTMPSVYAGGALTVRHGEEAETFEGPAARLEVPTTPHWAAYYADCEHEVTPLTAGHRVVLVYNLVRPPTGGDSAVAAADNEGVALPSPPVRGHGGSTAVLARFAREWAGYVDFPTTPTALLYLLDHKYTADGVGWASLKGKDALLAAALRATPAPGGSGGGGSGGAFHLHLVTVHVHQQLGVGVDPAKWGYESPPEGGRWEDAGMRVEVGPTALRWSANGKRRRDGCLAGDDAASTGGSYMDSTLTLRGWVAAPGTTAAADRGGAPQVPPAAELCPPSWVRGIAAVAALTPEGVDVEPSGNDGDVPTRWYRTYALIVSLAGAPRRSYPKYDRGWDDDKPDDDRAEWRRETGRRDELYAWTIVVRA